MNFLIVKFERQFDGNNSLFMIFLLLDLVKVNVYRCAKHCTKTFVLEVKGHISLISYSVTRI